MTLYQKGSLAVCNVPVTELATSVQYVQNVQTGAWCQFTGINAYCWAVANDNAYFGATDGVYLWDTGYADDQTDIVADLQTAFNYFGSRGDLKKFEMIQPVLRIATSVSPAIEVLTDFKSGVPTAVPTTVATDVALWDSAIWDTSLWANSTETRDLWTSVTGIGYCGSVRMRVTIDAINYVALSTADDTALSFDGSGIVVTTDPARNSSAPVEVIAYNLKFENQSGGQL